MRFLNKIVINRTKQTIKFNFKMKWSRDVCVPPPTSKQTIQEISDSFKFLIDTPEDLWLKLARIVSLIDWLLL